MKLSHILGINARTKLYSYPYNSWKGKKIARSKIQTAKALKKAGIPTPRILKKFRNLTEIEEYDWGKLTGSFVVKPSKGLGGEGIIVVRKRVRVRTRVHKVLGKGKKAEAKQEYTYVDPKDGPTWITANKRRVGVADLKLHVLDILEGAYSLGNVPDVAFIQEYVGRHKDLSKYAFRGTPDIRVIVFNKVPVMAMLRLPTRDSGGRANLHQGAIGVGIDMATGITTHAIWYGDTVKYKPGTKLKLSGVKVPEWSRILRLAIEAQAASRLGYLGVDFVLHPERGPMILEINSSPGLQIQMANQEGLRRRIDRVEDLAVRDIAHGANIAKALFITPTVSKFIADPEAKEVVSPLEEIKIKGEGRKRKKVLAKIDTGAWRTSVDIALAKELGLLKPEHVIKRRIVRSALGKEERPVIVFEYWLKGLKITTAAGVTDRKNLKRKVIIGRKDLGRFLIKPTLKEEEKWLAKTSK